MGSEKFINEFSSWGLFSLLMAATLLLAVEARLLEINSDVGTGVLFW